MNRKTRFIGLLLSVMLLLTAQSAIAQFYFSNPNAELAYGLPVTEAFLDSETGLKVQYFKKVRFEYHPENLQGDKVRLTPLGRLLYEHGTYINDLTSTTPGCSREDHWDYSVCFSFYDFYQSNGGEAQFGRPVSGLEYLRGRIVQFFEYAQLVWMPENLASAQIVVEQLGLKYFYAHETNYDLLNPITNFGYFQNIDEISISAFPKSAVISNSELQEIDVIAKDQNGAPLSNGIVHVSLRYPDGSQTEIQQLTTDEFGLANFAFITNSTELGPVEVIVRVIYNQLEEVSVTSFRLWY
ncbi:MAG: hypothetical protein P8Y68_20555 [Anaerolineales bacterium]